MTRRRRWRSWARHSKRWAQVWLITAKSILIWRASVMIRGSKRCWKPLNSGSQLRLTANRSSSPRSFFATLKQPRRFHPLRPLREFARRTAPPQRLDFFEKWRIGAQGREFLEEQREFALF